MTRYYRDGRLTEEWERDALAAVQAFDRAMQRAEAACEVPPADRPPVDLNRAALDDRVRVHMTAHPGLSYADALNALPPIDPEPQVELDPERAALNSRVLAFAADHQLPYPVALERVLSEP